MIRLVILSVLVASSVEADAQCELQSGTCRYLSDGCSGGEFWSGKCDGPSDRKCCIPGSDSGDGKCVNDEEGYCQDNYNPCSGSYLTGKCAGAAARQCCVPVAGGGGGAGDAQCELQSGACTYLSEGCSGGVFWSGKCAGAADRQCCIPGSDSGDGKCVNDEGGYCQDNSDPCSGSYLSGKCAGAAARQCCVPGTGAGGGLLRAGQICSSNPTNQIRECDDYGCGNYGAPRGSRIHYGADVICTMGSDVSAPFPGTLERQSNPYTNDDRCCNTGLLFRGTGTWADYEVKMFYISAVQPYGTAHSQGDIIATHVGLHCGCYGSGMTDHIHFQLYKSGTIVNPTDILVG